MLRGHPLSLKFIWGNSRKCMGKTSFLYFSARWRRSHPKLSKWRFNSVQFNSVYFFSLSPNSSFVSAVQSFGGSFQLCIRHLSQWIQIKLVVKETENRKTTRKKPVTIEFYYNNLLIFISTVL
uniref:(northern house mosquito) hypothetical protein n=1 Tax=Culex pipiens TaxID=7175 RepID=A0A8D8I556_CULPI